MCSHLDAAISGGLCEAETAQLPYALSRHNDVLRTDVQMDHSLHGVHVQQRLGYLPAQRTDLDHSLIRYLTRIKISELNKLSYYLKVKKILN